MAVDNARLTLDDLPLDYLGEEVPLGVSIPERVLQEILKAGMAKLHEDPSLFDDLLYKLDSDSLRDIKSFFSSHNVSVQLDFPIDPITSPMLSVLATNDSEKADADLLGDHMTDLLAAGTGYAGEIIGHAVRSNYTIYCLAGKDSNAAMWLYYAAKAILVLNLEALVAHGLMNVTMSGGDISFREDLLPEMLYARQLTITCDNYFCVRRNERVASQLEFTLFVQAGDSATINVTSEDED